MVFRADGDSDLMFKRTVFLLCHTDTRSDPSGPIARKVAIDAGKAAEDTPTDAATVRDAECVLHGGARAAARALIVLHARSSSGLRVANGPH